MRLKRCKHCGRDFETAKQGAYLCPECALAARRASERYGQPKWNRQ